MVWKMWPVLSTLCAVWVTVNAISVETPRNALRAARGKSVTLPCTYHTSISDRNGFIEWNKLLRSHTEKVLIWTLWTKTLIYGKRYENRVNISDNSGHSDASITIDQLTMDDNGTYECSVSLMLDLEGTSKSRVQLLVLEPRVSNASLSDRLAPRGPALTPLTFLQPRHARPRHVGPRHVGARPRVPARNVQPVPVKAL